NYATALTAHVAAKNAAESATENKDEVRETGEDFVRTIVRMLQANPDVTDAQRESLGIPVHDSVRTPIAAPTVQPVLIPRDTLHLGRTFRIVTAEEPNRRGKAAGVANYLIFAKVGGTTPPASITECYNICM